MRVSEGKVRGNFWVRGNQLLLWGFFNPFNPLILLILTFLTLLSLWSYRHALSWGYFCLILPPARFPRTYVRVFTLWSRRPHVLTWGYFSSLFSSLLPLLLEIFLALSLWGYCYCWRHIPIPIPVWGNYHSHSDPIIFPPAYDIPFPFPFQHMIFQANQIRLFDSNIRYSQPITVIVSDDVTRVNPRARSRWRHFSQPIRVTSFSTPSIGMKLKLTHSPTNKRTKRAQNFSSRWGFELPSLRSLSSKADTHPLHHGELRRQRWNTSIYVGSFETLDVADIVFFFLSYTWWGPLRARARGASPPYPEAIIRIRLFGILGSDYSAEISEVTA